jgi:hypothetical protein
MSATMTPRAMTLSARLLRKGRTIQNALRDDHDLQESEAELGRLFVGQAPAAPPTWTPFISQFSAGALPRLVNQSCAAVLFLDIAVDGSPPMIGPLSHSGLADCTSAWVLYF